VRRGARGEDGERVEEDKVKRGVRRRSSACDAPAASSGLC
jgi:hypothetical protein